MPDALRLVACLLALASQAESGLGQTERVSLDSAGQEAHGDSERATTSADGRWVAFESRAADLVPGDTNRATDVFVRDRQTGITERVSLGPLGLEANGASSTPTISADGRWVAFRSLATNLVAGDTNGMADVFVHDRSSGVTRRVSVGAAGSQADGPSAVPRQSADGTCVGFASAATNLVAGDTNRNWDAFVHVLASGLTERVSLSSQGAEGNRASFVHDLSADGDRVVFTSDATNLVPDDSNGVRDAFLRERSSGTTQRISLSSGGEEANGPTVATRISGDGKVVSLDSSAHNLVPGDTNGIGDVFVRDLESGLTTRVNVSSAGAQANGDSDASSLPFDGRMVGFTSQASNLVSGDTNGEWDIFVHDRLTAATVRASVAVQGQQAQGESHNGNLTSDGARITFDSSAANLVPGDGNGAYDVFLRELGPPCPAPVAYCSAKLNSLGCRPQIAAAGWPSLSHPAPFLISASEILSNVSGVLIYSKSGAAGIPFQGGTLCVLPPVIRTAGQSSGGNPPPQDCSGSLSFDFRAHALSGADPGLIVGAAVWVQYWSRDPGFPPPENTNLTDALAFSLCW